MDVSIIKAGRWGFSRIVRNTRGPLSTGWTTAAAQQRLTDGGASYFYPPLVAGAYAAPYALVRLRGNLITQPNSDTLLIPRNLDLAELTLGDLTAAQRLNLRNFIETWAAYQFTDWDGTLRSIPGMAARVQTYTASTLVRDLLRDLYRYLAHSASRPRPSTFESHNTEHLDDFSTDPFSDPRWTNDRGTAVYDGTNDELDMSFAIGHPQCRYSVNDAGSMEQEAQITSVWDGLFEQAAGAAVRMDNAGGQDCYFTAWDRTDLLIYRSNGGSPTLFAQDALSGTAFDFFTNRLAAAGSAGNNVVLSWWTDNHGASKPTDPGWYGVDGAPDGSDTDSSVDRLDAAGHLDCGSAGIGAGVDHDSRSCFFKLRAISDRSSGEVTGTGVLAAQSADISGAALSASSGTGVLAAQSADVEGSGLSSSSGSGTLAAQAADLEGAGLSLSTGTGTLDAQDAAVEGAGEAEGEEITGTGVLTAQAATIDGAGLSLSSGTGALNAQAATVDGTGDVEVEGITGTGTLIAQAAQVDGAGLSGSAGTGSLAAQEAVLEAMAISASVGSGALVPDAALLDGAGLSLSIGSGTLSAQAATVAGDGNTEGGEITGTGELVAQAASVVGVGTWESVRRLAAARTGTRGGPIRARQGSRVPKRG